MVGAWQLVTWRRIDPGGVSVYPLGESPRGILIYTPDGHMAVQMLRRSRPAIDTDDPLGGSESARAEAYSSCLAYYGRYEVDGDRVIHHVEGCLFPNWSDTAQDRPLLLRGNELSLQVFGADGHLTNEIVWARAADEASAPISGAHPSRGDVRPDSGRFAVAERRQSFLGLSAALTGFDRLQLLGTGVAEQYLRTLDAIVPAETLARLLSAYDALPSGEGKAPALAADILGDAELGPVARNLILLWYSGSWKRLPDDWRAAHGKSPLDETHVVSPAAYLAGLQWAVVGAHPQGGQQQGFGSWAEPPLGGKR